MSRNPYSVSAGDRVRVSFDATVMATYGPHNRDVDLDGPLGTVRVAHKNAFLANLALKKLPSSPPGATGTVVQHRSNGRTYLRTEGGWVGPEGTFLAEIFAPREDWTDRFSVIYSPIDGTEENEQ